MPMQPYGEKGCSPSSSSLPSAWTYSAGDHGTHCLGLSTLGPCVWHIHERELGGPVVSASWGVTPAEAGSGGVRMSQV